MAGTPLTGQTKASTYDSLLKITDNGPVGGTEKVVTDGLGNDTALKVGTGGISSTGTIASAGAISSVSAAAGAVFIANSALGYDSNVILQSNGTTKGIIGIAGSPGSTVADSSTNDGVWRQPSGSFRITVDDGLTTHAKVTSTGINSTAIGVTAPAAGAFTTLTASSTATLNTLASSGATITGGTVNNAVIGGSTPAAGTFTALSAPFVKQSGGNKRLAADFVKTADTATATITGLSVDVTAGETYSFEANLFCLQSGSGGYVVGIGGTATATAFYGGITWFTGAASVINDALPNFPGGSATSTSQSAYRVCANGTITVNAGGTLTVYFAQASATGSSTVKRGSYLHVTQY